jgi:ubiquitin C-terminal hydrolase
MDLQKVRDSKIGSCGLINIGNTCYLNSVIQLLIHSKNFVKFVLKIEDSKGQYEDFLQEAAIDKIATLTRKRLNLTDSDRVSIDRSDIVEIIESSITKQLSEIVNTIINKGNSVITPISLKRSIDKKLSYFRGASQQDAHELLIQLLGCIEEETGIESEPEINNVPLYVKEYIQLLEQVKTLIKGTTDIEERKAVISKFNEYRKQHKTMVNNYMGVVHMERFFKKRYNPFIYQYMAFAINRIECLNCKNVNTNFEDISVLTLQVSNSLKECLDVFIQPEEIDNYKCSVCDSIQKAVKTTKLWRTPHVLFIHFKRFKMHGSGRLLKDNTNISIPHEINLSNYCDDSLYTENTVTPNYKLKGISNHHGGMGGGHYTADCACLVNENVWYNFDDSRVSRYSNSNINTNSAYILMYEMNL